MFLETNEHLFDIVVSLLRSYLQFFFNSRSYFVSLLLERNASFFYILNVILKNKIDYRRTNNVKFGNVFEIETNIEQYF